MTVRSSYKIARHRKTGNSVMDRHAVGYEVHTLNDDCCPAVVDKLTFFGTLSFIAAGTFYILALLLLPLLGGRRKRRSLVAPGAGLEWPALHYSNVIQLFRGEENATHVPGCCNFHMISLLS